jgi:hypothetical protein
VPAKVECVRITVKNKDIFPSEVLELLKALHWVGFFADSMLIGSWVMPLYREVFGINYALRTMDIDFAVKFVHPGRDSQIDLEKVITDLGYLPVIMHSGIRRFTRENFTIEFVIHRKGGRDHEIVSVKQWNITASPLPFVDLLLSFPLIADFGDFEVRVPIPEAYFVHKMIASQRRRGEGKKDKDLDQCSVIAPRIDPERLKAVVETFKISKKTQKVLRASCEAIDFPPQKLGL